MNKNRKGFTLIELLVVIAIIGLLATIAVVSFRNANDKAKDAKKMADLRTMQSALELYNTDNSSYPTPASGWTWTGSLASYLSSNYIQSLPKPPDTTVYTYCSNGSKYLFAAVMSTSANTTGSITGVPVTASYGANGAASASCVASNDGNIVPTGCATSGGGLANQFCLGSL